MDRVHASCYDPSVMGEERLYAIVDAARDARLREAAVSSGGDWRCLYAGPLPEEVQKAAPYLVALAPGLPLVDFLRGEGWGRSFGVLVRSSAGIDELRKHLRRFLLARLPSGKKSLFRYYDPRVLRVYLPTCNADELRFVFGEPRVVSSFVCEDEDQAPVRYRLDEAGALVGEDVGLEAAFAAEGPPGP
jgi:hypothetical protein